MQLVVIGNGIAALSAIERIRQSDQDCKITLFSQEPYHTYNRLKLSKNITEYYQVDDILVKPESWYQEKNVECYLDTPIVHVDFSKQQVLTVEGEVFPYTHLLLANGASNNIPPIEGIDLERVFALRTYHDAQEIRVVANNFKQILIIGGGLLGLELAWEFYKKDKQVSIVELFPHLLPRQLDEDSACYLEELIIKQGVDLYLCQQIASLIGEHKLAGFTLKNDSQVYPTEVALYSTGIRPNIELYKGSALAINRGVIVNQHMQTNLPNVYAAGDISEYNGRIYGLWSVARTQGQVAADNILGRTTSFVEEAVMANIQVFDQHIISIGTVNGEAMVTAFERTNDLQTIKKLFFSNEQIQGAVLINAPKEALLIKKAINNQVLIPRDLLDSYSRIIEYLQSYLVS